MMKQQANWPSFSFGLKTKMHHAALAIPFVLVALSFFPPSTKASHTFGPRIDANPPVVIGPDSGLAATEGNKWIHVLEDESAKFLILRLLSNIDDGDEVTIELGYDTDVFHVSSAPVLYSRPIGGTTATITYEDKDNDGDGGVTLIEYGRGDVIDVFGVSEPCVFEEPIVITETGVCPLQPFPSTPSWVDVACDSVDDIVKEVSKSVGMYLFLTGSKVASCTATLVDENLLLTSGHCIGHVGEEVDFGDYRTVEVNSASFTLDVEAGDCFGNCPEDYNPKFYRVLDVQRSKFVQGVAGIDYAFLEIDPTVIPDGIEPIDMLEDTDGLSVGDQVFIVHHPTGRAKKVSDGTTDPGTCEILGFTNPDGIKHIIAGCDIDNGSSGSSMFDANTGKLIANTDLFNWADCGGRFILSSEINKNFLSEPPPNLNVDAMMVLDRSGSMIEIAQSGVTKMEELKESAKLFVELLRLGVGHKIGLVSFSSSALLDYPLSSFVESVKNDLISGGVIDDLISSGATSIGGGLLKAQEQFSDDPLIKLLKPSNDGWASKYTSIH